MGVEYYIALEERSPDLTERLKRLRDQDQQPNPTRLMDPFYFIGTSAATKPRPTFTLHVERSFLEEANPDTKLYGIGDSRGIESIGGLLDHLSRFDINVIEQSPYN